MIETKVVGSIDGDIPNTTEWHSMVEALRDRYGYVYTSKGSVYLDFSNHPHIRRTIELLLKAAQQESELLGLRPTLLSLLGESNER